MKKLFTNLNSLLVATALLFTSCSYDDTGLWDELNGVKGEVADLTERVAELEEKLGTEVAALKAMIEAQVVVSGYEKDENSGDITVTLSDGKKFTVYAESENSAVTVVTENGVQYWAVVDANDTAVPVLDAEGNKIPVVPVKEEPVLPQFAKSEDGSKVVVSFDGGLTWSETGAATTEALDKVSLFSGVEVTTKTDLMAGMEYPASVVVTLKDGSTFTLDLDPALVELGIPYLMGPQFSFATYDGTAVEEQYVAYETTAVLPIKSACVVDFLIEKPQGWKVSIEDEREEGDTEPFWSCYVTAPSADAVAAGTADKLGKVKVFAVLENGKVIPDAVAVSADPFKSVSISAGVANVEMYSMNGFIYGLCPASQYDEMKIMMWAGYLGEYDLALIQQQGFPGVGYKSWEVSLSQSLAEMWGAELDKCAYVFWVLPLDETGYLPESLTSIEQTVEVPYAELSMEGMTANVVADSSTPKFYALITNADETNIEGIVRSMNLYDVSDPTYQNDSPFSGDVSTLKVAGNKPDLKPLSEYTLYVFPYDKLKEKEDYNNSQELGGYTVADALTATFTVPAPTEKSTIITTDLTLDETTEKISIAKYNVTFGTEKGNMKYVYTAAVDAATLATLADDAAKVEYLLKNGTSTTTNRWSDTTNVTVSNLTGGVTYTLLAVAFDAEWKFSNIVTREFTTNPLAYNEMSVTISSVVMGTYSADPKRPEYSYNENVTVNCSATGSATVDHYRVCVQSAYNCNRYWGDSAENAVLALMDDPSETYFKKVAVDALPYVAKTNSFYANRGPIVVMVVAVTKDSNGKYLYSHPAEVRVEIGGNGYTAQ